MRLPKVKIYSHTHRDKWEREREITRCAITFAINHFIAHKLKLLWCLKSVDKIFNNIVMFWSHSNKPSQVKTSQVRRYHIISYAQKPTRANACEKKTKIIGYQRNAIRNTESTPSEKIYIDFLSLGWCVWLTDWLSEWVSRKTILKWYE